MEKGGDGWIGAGPGKEIQGSAVRCSPNSKLLSVSSSAFTIPRATALPGDSCSPYGIEVTNARTTSSLTSGPTSMTAMSVTRCLGAA